MNYFKYYQQLMEKIMPVKDGTSMTHYHKAVDINKNATKIAFEDFAGREFSDEQFNDLLTLCRNAKEEEITQSKRLKAFNQIFTVSRHGQITRI